jgi:hypothetical protein
MAVTLNALTTGVGGLQTTGDTSGQISLQSNGSTVLTMTASGVSVTGTLTASTALGIGSGGTGATTATAAFDALNPMTTTGDIIYESTPSVAARLPIGSTGQVLTVAGGLPSWAAAAGGQYQATLFTAPGTFTTPATVTRVKVTVIGGGGGGASPNSNSNTPGGAGGTSSFGSLVSSTGGSGSSPGGGTYNAGGVGTVTTGTAYRTGSLYNFGPNGSTMSVSGVISGAVGGNGQTGVGTYSTSGTQIAGGGGDAGQGKGGPGGVAIAICPVTASTGYAITIGSGGPASPNAGSYGTSGAVLVEFIG